MSGGTGGQPPGWYADPSGRFEHRLWDGTRWTEQVSTGGVQTTEAPAGTAGAPLATAALAPRPCWQCGAASHPMAAVCVNCGVPLNLAPPGAKSKVTAGILGIFLGGFGVHRFYLGYTSIGVIQIVVTLLTCGLASLWGTIEGILILTGNIDRDAQGRPLAQ